MKMEDNRVGIKIRRIRAQRNLSQRKLAKELGVTQGYISKVEAGANSPTVDLLFKLRRIYRLNVNKLFDHGE